MTFPRIIPDRDKVRKWYLDEDVRYTMTTGDVLVIKKGYRFNGHSVPFIFRWLFPMYDVDIYAALIHDFLFDTQPWHRFDRKTMDDEYNYLMKQHSYGLRTKLMPLAVYLAGYIKTFGWRDYRGEPKPNTQIEVSVTW